MQLFITPYARQGNNVLITEERVVHQLSKVLRAKKGDQITVQQGSERLVCELVQIEKKHITAQMLEEVHIQSTDDQRYLAVALPNKFEKLELIVQKATEIGVQHIIFFPAKHSLLKEITDAKMERLEKISLEASEQSRGKNISHIQFVKNIFNFCEGKNIFVAHQDGKQLVTRNLKLATHDEKLLLENGGGQAILLVGPEGGRHADEEKMFDTLYAEKISFGETILRTETAAILGARWIK